MNCREFIDFNTNVSSEMFISVISILQERLPCSHYVYRSKKTFKQQEFIKNQRSLMAGLSVNTTRISDDSLVAKAEEMCLSPLKAIASPRLLTDLRLKNKSSTFKPENLNTNGTPSTNNSSIANRKSSHCEPTDFKIKKRVDVENTR
jgi:hypothetical protein